MVSGEIWWFPALVCACILVVVYVVLDTLNINLYRHCLNVCSFIKLGLYYELYVCEYFTEPKRTRNRAYQSRRYVRVTRDIHKPDYKCVSCISSRRDQCTAKLAGSRITEQWLCDALTGVNKTILCSQRQSVVGALLVILARRLLANTT